VDEWDELETTLWYVGGREGGKEGGREDGTVDDGEEPHICTSKRHTDMKKRLEEPHNVPRLLRPSRSEARQWQGAQASPPSRNWTRQ
jgi:hypothetical protein